MDNTAKKLNSVQAKPILKWAGGKGHLIDVILKCPPAMEDILSRFLVAAHFSLRYSLKMRSLQTATRN